MVARLIFLIPEVGILVAFAHWVLGVPVRGSLVALTVVSLAGALSFSGLGLLVAARPPGAGSQAAVDGGTGEAADPEAAAPDDRAAEVEAVARGLAADLSALDSVKLATAGSGFSASPSWRHCG